jgi:hypothetical protein
MTKIAASQIRVFATRRDEYAALMDAGIQSATAALASVEALETSPQVD